MEICTSRDQMANSIYLLLVFIVLSSLPIQCHSESFLSSVTVPRDFFFNEIRNNANLFHISSKNSSDYKCIAGLQEIITQLPSLKVLPFIDAWGSIPSGILRLHLIDIGNFDQCLAISVNLSEVTGVVNGQHCFASIDLPFKSQHDLEMPWIIGDTLKDPRNNASDVFRVRIGICVPDTCSPDVVTPVFRQAISNVSNGTLSTVTVSECQVAKKPEYEGVEIAGMLIFSIFGVLMVLSSAYDLLMGYFDKTPIPTLLAFSVFTNGKQLFAIKTKKSPNSIDCIAGIRVLSMIWIMYFHTYSMTFIAPSINTLDILLWWKEAWSMHVLNAPVAVDSFFFISGLLVAWLRFRELDKTDGKLNIVMMYIHRYIRLTPAVAAVIIFLVSFNTSVATGPLRSINLMLNGECSKEWWSIMLYVQNYVYPMSRCITQSWYLAVDFQLYILSPFLLIPMWKWGKKFAPVLVVLALLSIGYVIAVYFIEGYTSLWGFVEKNQGKHTYFPTHTRCPPWLVGLGLGYYMHINRQRSFRLSKMSQLLGWIVSFAIILVVIFGPYFRISFYRFSTVFEAAMHESLKRVSWAIALAWIVFACHFGFGGVINTFLAHNFWQPLGRLTYSLYLVQFIVLGVNVGTTRTNMYFSNYSVILFFWSTFGISFIAAIVLTLAFEAPVLILEEAIFSRGTPKKNGNASITATTNNAYEVPQNKNV